MTTPGNGYGSGPDDQPRYGVRLPGQQPPAQASSEPDPSASGSSEPQGWDAPRPGAAPQGQSPQPYPGGYPGSYGAQPSGNGTFGPYVPDDYRNSRGASAGGPGGVGPAGSRPKQVTAAAIVLWIAAGVYTLMMVGSLAMVMGMDLRQLLQQSVDSMPAGTADAYNEILDNVGTGEIRSALVFTMVLVVIVGVLAAVAAWRTFKGSNPWRIAGTVCGAAMALYQVFMVLTSPLLGLPGLAVCIVVIVLWFTKPASAWFRARTAQRRGF